MSEPVKKQAKQKKSQVPVALVYFATLMLFIAVFGLIASFIIDKLNEMNNPQPVNNTTSADSFNLLYAHVNNKNVLAEMAVIRVSPDKNKVVLLPVSSYIKNNGSDNTFREVYEDGGIVKLKSAVENTFDFKVDNYVTVSNKAYERLIDMIGGIIYTPKEDLYYIAKNDADDISIRSGQAISLVGRQIRLISQYPVFESGKEGNLEFMGEALSQLVTSALRQTSITKNNLDNMYNIITENSDTDWDKNAFKIHKTYIKKMLDTNDTECILLTPAGEWSDNKMRVSDEFKADLKKTFNETEPAEIED